MPMDLAKMFETVLPEGSPPITFSDFERRILDVLYPTARRVVGGRNHTFFDTALVSAAVQSYRDFGLVRFTAADGTSGATLIGSDLVHRTGRILPPARSPFGPQPGHGMKVALVDEFDQIHDWPVGAKADAEIERVRRIRRTRRVEQIRRDMQDEDISV